MRPPRALARLGLLALVLGLTACGNVDREETAAEAIVPDPANGEVELTIGSPRGAERAILAEIYAQALAAAGYEASAELDLGDGDAARAALEAGAIGAYPEYVSAALSGLGLDAAELPADPRRALDRGRAELEATGIVASPPTPFTSTTAVALLRKTANQLGISRLSELEGLSEELTLAGPPDCPGRADCLVALEQGYGLRFERFLAVPADRRLRVLDNERADLSIVTATDPELAGSDRYLLLKDDRELLPPGNATLLVDGDVAAADGADLEATVELVQRGLTEEVMRVLNARVELEGETPESVARQYLIEAGFVE